MFAVINTGGKQYLVRPGVEINVELLREESFPQGALEFREVLMLGDENSFKVGQPLVEGACVKAQVLGEIRGPKQIILKKIRTKDKRLKKGHRQDYLRVKITEICQ